MSVVEVTLEYKLFVVFCAIVCTALIAFLYHLYWERYKK